MLAGHLPADDQRRTVRRRLLHHVRHLPARGGVVDVGIHIHDVRQGGAVREHVAEAHKGDAGPGPVDNPAGMIQQNDHVHAGEDDIYHRHRQLGLDQLRLMSPGHHHAGIVGELLADDVHNVLGGGLDHLGIQLRLDHNIHGGLVDGCVGRDNQQLVHGTGLLSPFFF